MWTRDQAAASLLVNVGDMLSFAVWFGAAIWLSPIFIGMLHDWITRRRIHPVYTIGSIALFLFAFRLLVARSETWLNIGRPIIDSLR